MKLFFLTLLCFLIYHSADAQRRVALDMNYRPNALGLTLGYHKVVKGKWLLSASLSAGKKGKYYSEDYISFGADLPIETAITSPWSKLNKPYESDEGTHYLKDFIVENRSITVQGGLGYYHSFNIDHGIRTHLFAQFGYALDEVRVIYNGYEYPRKSIYHSLNYPIGALSLEAYHTIRIYQKFTFYYGFKMPYYFILDKNQFNPQHNSYNFYRWMPEVGLGVTYLIGDCD